MESENRKNQAEAWHTLNDRMMWSDPLWTPGCLLLLAKCENEHKTIKFGVLTQYLSWVMLEQYCSISKKLQLFSSKAFNWNSFQPLFTNASLYAAIFAYAAFMCNIIPSHHKKLPCINNPMLKEHANSCRSFSVRMHLGIYFLTINQYTWSV